MTKVVSPLSIYSYIKQVQYFLPLPSSVGCLLSQTKELDTLNWSLWWIVFEVRSLYRYIGFIPAQPGFQPSIDASNLCEDQSIIRRRVIEPLWERWFWWLPVYRLFLMLIRWILCLIYMHRGFYLCTVFFLFREQTCALKTWWWLQQNNTQTWGGTAGGIRVVKLITSPKWIISRQDSCPCTKHIILPTLTGFTCLKLKEFIVPVHVLSSISNMDITQSWYRTLRITQRSLYNTYITNFITIGIPCIMRDAYPTEGKQGLSDSCFYSKLFRNAA